MQNTLCIICPFMTKSSSLRPLQQIKHTKSRVISTAKQKTQFTLSVVRRDAQYVGQTGNTIKDCIRGNLTDIWTGNQLKPVSCHFTVPNHTIHNVRVIVITQTMSDVNFQLHTKEAWINTLKTKEPDCLNLIQG